MESPKTVSAATEARTPSPGRPLLLRNVAVGFPAARVLSGVTLEWRPGECWLLQGPNGSGKTTLLRTVAGLLPLLGGKIDIPHGMGLAYVPAETAMNTPLPLRLDEVVLMGAYRLQSHGVRYRATLRARARELLGDSGLWEKRAQAFSRSSSGEKQRTLLARALMSSPHLLLMDEPTTNLDRDSLGYFMDVLRVLREQGMGMVIATHAHQQFSTLSPRLLDIRDGRVLEA
ncbi:MAG: ATP-binding cassette domain-containing protein [SAR324 cluster bacterium]|nr:ATP-binding cassette domain-containing protein [SAR324 cluster bacterium]